MSHLELDTGLSDKAIAVSQEAVKFAVEVMRPAGIELDSLADPVQVIADESKLYSVFKQYREFGFHRPTAPTDSSRSKDDSDRLTKLLLLEALGYGDAGLAVALSTDSIPFEFAALSNESELTELAQAYRADTIGELVGCWIDLRSVPTEYAGMNGNEYIIQNYKTNWITNGSIATHAVIMTAVTKPAKPLVAVVPLDLPGISRGAPIEKMGLRALNQCEIILEQVKIPEKYIIDVDGIAENLLSSLHTGTGQIAIGLAQAALDESNVYANDRIQGGVPIVQHNHIKLKLFNVFAEIASNRAFARSVALGNGANEHSMSTEHAVAFRIIASELAFKATSEAIQIFGGNGLMKAFTVEKMMRDAGSLMNINGKNDALALEALSDLQCYSPHMKSRQASRASA